MQKKLVSAGSKKKVKNKMSGEIDKLRNRLHKSKNSGAKKMQVRTSMVKSSEAAVGRTMLANIRNAQMMKEKLESVRAVYAALNEALGLSLIHI